MSPSLSLQLDVRELLTGGPNGTKDDPAGAKILQLIHKLAVSEAAAPQQYSCIADAASDLARAYRERGQLFLASVYFQQALASREAELVPITADAQRNVQSRTRVCGPEKVLRRDGVL